MSPWWSGFVVGLAVGAIAFGVGGVSLVVWAAMRSVNQRSLNRRNGQG